MLFRCCTTEGLITEQTSFNKMQIALSHQTLIEGESSDRTALRK